MTISGIVESVHSGRGDDMSKQAQSSIRVELDGIVGDGHRSYERSTWDGDKQPKGTTRRNERQWSAVSVEELRAISAAMGLTSTLSATDVGANLCFSGIRELSRLPKGTVIKFPSGAELIVVEYNPPCLDMGKKIAGLYEASSGAPIEPTAFSKAAKLTRGIVGVVDVAGDINSGDEVEVDVYETPSWLQRTPD